MNESYLSAPISKPYASNLAIIRSCRIQSNALDKSVNSAPKTPLWSIIYVISQS